MASGHVCPTGLVFDTCVLKLKACGDKSLRVLLSSLVFRLFRCHFLNLVGGGEDGCNILKKGHCSFTMAFKVHQHMLYGHS